jgi:hypothetical protein
MAQSEITGKDRRLDGKPMVILAPAAVAIEFLANYFP